MEERKEEMTKEDVQRIVNELHKEGKTKEEIFEKLMTYMGVKIPK